MTITINNYQKQTTVNIEEYPEANFLYVPARSECIRQFLPINSESDQYVPASEISPGVYTCRSIVCPRTPFVRIINTNDFDTKIPNKLSHTDNINEYELVRSNNTTRTTRTQTLIDILTPNFPKHVQKELSALCTEYSDIFHLDSDQLTSNNFYEQTIRLQDKSPVYIKNYRIPYTHKEEINKQIDKLLKDELIEPSTSSYNSPLLIVPKKSTNGERKYRMVIDYRQLNRKVATDKFPLPRIEEIFDNLGKAIYFSVLDMASGFHQIKIEKKSRHVTSFSCDKGSYQWKVLPFGLNISPNSFSRMMSIAFSGLQPSQCFLYIDDVIVIGKSKSHHLKNLRAVFDVCRKSNLKLNPEKAQFFRPEVVYLGHKCTQYGILPDPEKLKAVAKLPKPANKDATKRFVAMANFYRKHIQNFAEITRPLNYLSKKKVPFVWTDECENSFNILIKKLTNPPILAYPQFDKQFTIVVDASNYTMGAVLCQEHNSNEHPISYASKNFTPGEFNKSTIEKELTAIHWAIKHYAPYVHNTFFRVKSDHRPLVHLFSMKNPN